MSGCWVFCINKQRENLINFPSNQNKEGKGFSGKHKQTQRKEGNRNNINVYFTITCESSSATVLSPTRNKRGAKEWQRKISLKKSTAFHRMRFQLLIFLGRWVNDTRKEGKKGKSIFVECQVLSYDKMKWVWDARSAVRWVWLMASFIFVCVHFSIALFNEDNKTGKTGESTKSGMNFSCS